MHYDGITTTGKRQNDNLKNPVNYTHEERRELKSVSAAIVKALSPKLDFVRTSGVKSTVTVTGNLRAHEDDLKIKKSLSYSRAKPFTSLNPFTARVFFMKEFCEVTLTFEFVDEILRCDHSNESSLPVLSHDAICFSKF